MPYNKQKKKCIQSDGDKGSYVLSYTTKKGKKREACHTSKKNMQGQIAAIESESVEHNEKNQALIEIINSILLEDVSTSDVVSFVAGGPLGYAYKKAGEYGASQAKKKIIDPGVEALIEKLPELINPYARKDATVKRLLSSSDSEIVKHLFDNLPTPTRTKHVRLFNKDNIKIIVSYTRAKNLYLEISADGPLNANIELKFNIDNLLFKDITESGIENWVTNLHGSIFGQIKNVAINFVGQEEFKKYKKRARKLFQENIVVNKDQIITEKEKAIQAIAKVFRDNPSYFIALNTGKILSNIDIPGDWQRDWEREIVSYIQDSIGEALETSRLGIQLGNALDDLNEMIEKMHELKRSELEKSGIIGQGLAAIDRLTEINKIKIKKYRLQQIILEEIKYALSIRNEDR